MEVYNESVSGRGERGSGNERLLYFFLFWFPVFVFLRVVMIFVVFLIDVFVFLPFRRSTCWPLSRSNRKREY